MPLGSLAFDSLGGAGGISDSGSATSGVSGNVAIGGLNVGVEGYDWQAVLRSQGASVLPSGRGGSAVLWIGALMVVVVLGVVVWKLKLKG